MASKQKQRNANTRHVGGYVPQELYMLLKARAERNYRTIIAEVKLALESYLREDAAKANEQTGKVA